jgi:ribosomal protein S18 acetylase RimI-like enzyme
LNEARPPAASATINWHPEGCPHGAGWCIDEMQVRVRYRGVGLDEALIRQAQAILARNGMSFQGINP